MGESLLNVPLLFCRRFRVGKRIMTEEVEIMAFHGPHGLSLWLNRHWAFCFPDTVSFLSEKRRASDFVTALRRHPDGVELSSGIFAFKDVRVTLSEGDVVHIAAQLRAMAESEEQLVLPVPYKMYTGSRLAPFDEGKGHVTFRRERW